MFQISSRLKVSSKFSKKMNEQIRRSSKNKFVGSLFGRIRGYQKSFWNYLTFTYFLSISIFMSCSK